MKTTHLILLAAFAGACAQPALAKDSPQEFLAKAVRADNSEILLGKLAEQKGSSDSVRKYGQMMQTDHGAHLAKAQALAQTAGVPTTDVTQDARDENDKLMKLSGRDFDKEFADYMVKTHQTVLSEYKDMAEDTNSKPVADFARNTIPTLEQHLKLAKALQ